MQQKPGESGLLLLSFTMPHMQNDQKISRPASSTADNFRKLQSGNLILVGMMGSGKTTMGRMLARHLERELQGTVSAVFDGRVQPRSGAISELEAKLGVEQGRLGLKQPILAHTVLFFSHAEVIMRSRGEAIQLEQGLVDAELFSGQFVGEIMGLRDTGTDQLNIRGTMQPRPAFFKGLENSSLLKVIRTQLTERPVPFRISGDLQNPGIHFEEFSMLFQSLQRELQ